MPSGELRRRTALHHAGISISEAQAFLKGRAQEVNVVSNSGQTALHVASVRLPPIVKMRSTHGSLQLPSSALVALLIESSADVHATDDHGDTALHMAAWRGTTNVLRILVSSGAEVNQRGYGGQTALELASLRGHAESVHALLEMGASAGAVDDGGQLAASLVGEPPVGRPALAGSAAVQGNATGSAGEVEDAAQAAELTQVTELHSEGWASRMRRLRPLAQRLLLLGHDASTVDPHALLREHNRVSAYHSVVSAYSLSDYRGACCALKEEASTVVWEERALLSTRACAALRRVVDSEGTTSVDSVDGLPNHDLVLPQVCPCNGDPLHPRSAPRRTPVTACQHF